MSIIQKVALAVIAGFVVLQLVPYRVDHPPVTQNAAWSSPDVEELARRSCFDCHSNEGKTPWYGHVAPISWWVNEHVQEGREKLNFSEVNQPQKEAHEAGEVVLEGEMPPDYYLRMHPEARLTDSERRTLARGLDETLRSVMRPTKDHHEGDEEDEEDEDEHEHEEEHNG